MDSIMRGRLAALMTATTVAVGIAGATAAQAHAVPGEPAASYCGRTADEACSPGGGLRHPKPPCNCGPTTVVNNQAFLPVLDLLFQGGSQGSEVEPAEPTAEPPVEPTPHPTTPEEIGLPLLQ